MTDKPLKPRTIAAQALRVADQALLKPSAFQETADATSSAAPNGALDTTKRNGTNPSDTIRNDEQ